MKNTPSHRRPITSPEDQSATFVELFFDLVFVFAVTQIVGILHNGLNWVSVGQAVLVFWLVWWAWTQFTWTLNAADTTHSWIELGTLVATAAAFFMAIALPSAFAGGALGFAAAYILVRVIGLGFQLWVTWADPSQRSAARTFALVSLGGLAAVLAGGLVGGAALYWLWGLAISLDVIAAAVGGQAEGWNLRPEHFAERHGLFVIIALGETLIVAASGVTDADWTPELMVVAALAVTTTCGLWWSYFPQTKPALEHALASRRGVEQARLARDVFSLLHFLMLCGVIAYAFAIEEAVAHPTEPLPFEVRLALALGLVLFVGGAAIAIRRATRRLMLPRVVLLTGTAVVIMTTTSIGSWVTLAIAFVGVALIALSEQLWGRWMVNAPT